MDEIDRAPSCTAEEEPTCDRFRLRHRWSRLSVIGQRCLAAGKEFALLALEDDVVLSMYLDKKASVAGPLHQPVPAPVVEIENGVPISGIDLGTRHPGFDELLEVALPAILQSRDIQVKAVV